MLFNLPGNSNNALIEVIEIFKCLGQILYVQTWDVETQDKTIQMLFFSNGWFLSSFEMGFGVCEIGQVDLAKIWNSLDNFF